MRFTKAPIVPILVELAPATLGSLPAAHSTLVTVLWRMKQVGSAKCKLESIHSVNASGLPRGTFIFKSPAEAVGPNIYAAADATTRSFTAAGLPAITFAAGCTIVWKHTFACLSASRLSSARRPSHELRSHD